jgi:hypothetical protein
VEENERGEEWREENGRGLDVRGSMRGEKETREGESGMTYIIFYWIGDMIMPLKNIHV